MPTANTKILQKHATKELNGFTLVELIVVITILAILGTIGFVSIQGYSSSARNSSRISNLVNLSNGLSLFREASGTLPLPESPLTLTASGVVVGYQGFARDQVASIAKLSAGATRDPLDTGIYMTYATNALLTKAQVMAYMEDGAKIMGDNLVPGVSVAYAGASSNYTNRIPTSKGDTVGILLGNTGSLLNQPVQELVTGSFTGVDLTKTTTGSGYTIVFSKDDTTASVATSGTGAYSGSLFTFVYNKRGDLIGNKLLAANDESLVGYWDMETLSGGLLKDLSKYGNDGTCYNSGSVVSCGGGSGGPQIVSGNGKSGKAMSFDGVDDYVAFGDKSILDMGYGDMTILYISKIKSNVPTLFISKAWSTPYFYIGSTDSRIDVSINTSSGSYASSVPIILNSYFGGAVIFKRFTYLEIYKDGQKRSTTNISSMASQDISNTNEFVLGANCAASCLGLRGNFLNGEIDEVRIYNRALSDSEIATLYNSTK